jgi:hypothetical protein
MGPEHAEYNDKGGDPDERLTLSLGCDASSTLRGPGLRNLCQMPTSLLWLSGRKPSLKVFNVPKATITINRTSSDV